jgi:hypothetical protein
VRLVTIDLDALPASLTDSIRAVLDHHGLALVRHSDTQSAWDGERLEQLLRELGRNASQVVACAEVAL